MRATNSYDLIWPAKKSVYRERWSTRISLENKGACRCHLCGWKVSNWQVFPSQSSDHQYSRLTWIWCWPHYKSVYERTLVLDTAPWDSTSRLATKSNSSGQRRDRLFGRRRKSRHKDFPLGPSVELFLHLQQHRHYRWECPQQPPTHHQLVERIVNQVGASWRNWARGSPKVLSKLPLGGARLQSAPIITARRYNKLTGVPRIVTSRTEGVLRLYWTQK